MQRELVFTKTTGVPCCRFSPDPPIQLHSGSFRRNLAIIGTVHGQTLRKLLFFSGLDESLQQLQSHRRSFSPAWRCIISCCPLQATMQTAMNQPRHCVTISPIIGVERWPSARNIDRLFDGIKLGWTVDGQRSAVPGSERCCPQQPARPHCVYLLRLAMSTHVAASLAVASADWLRQRTMITLVVLRRPFGRLQIPLLPAHGSLR